MSPNGTVVVTPAGRTLSVNGFVTFFCASEGGPNNAIQWSLSGVDLPGENGTSLTVADVDAADGGNYTCTVSNRAGVEQDTGVLFGECPHNSLYLYIGVSFLGSNDMQ